MILTKIKLVGFKSFVDATPILFPSRLVGIVGPNGCGKSNVIDAVRWVMGESTASRLRGEQGTDVIFNGSGGRQPLDQASVELIFDNSDASLGGEYAKYGEISVRRLVARDGLSQYFLNGTRCRRKDIADIFLGTGLGPRSYAIIQQGMISHLIDAKPDELRVLLEEAAGISKYKERRKETETRMRGARENLERLQDVRIELDKQLTALKRQAAAAERFKELKSEQRQSKSHLFALRWKLIHDKIHEHQEKIAAQETQLAAILADVRHVESRIEQVRLIHTEVVDVYNHCQSDYYRNNSELSRVEQEIKHQQERRRQLSQDFEQTESQWRTLLDTIERDREHIERLQKVASTLLPEFELAHEQSDLAQEQLNEVEAALTSWQTVWHEFREKISSASKTAEVEQAHIQQYEQRILAIQNKIQKLEISLTDIHLSHYESTITLLNDELDQQRETLHETELALTASKEEAHALQHELRDSSTRLDQLKQERQQLEGQRVSLEVLQAAALHNDDQITRQWLLEQGLSDKKRLAQCIQVDAGWEHAVETVLGDFLQSLCIDKGAEQHYAKELMTFKRSTLGMLSAHTSPLSKKLKLADKVQGDYLPDSLYHVFAVETLDEAFALQSNLQSHESVMTKDGLWLGNTWIRVAYEKNAAQGMLEREKELKKLVAAIENMEFTLEQQQNTHDHLAINLQHQQTLTEELRQRHQVLASRLSQKEADLSVQDRLLKQSMERRHTIMQEIVENQAEMQRLKDELSRSRNLWSQALDDLSTLEIEQAHLDQQKQEKMLAVQEGREHYQRAKQVFHDINVKKNITEVELKSLEKNVQQLQDQLTVLETRKHHLSDALSKDEDPILVLEAKKEQLIEDCLNAEQHLNAAREKVNVVEGEQRELEKGLRESEQHLSATQLATQHILLEVEGLRVRKQTLEEQLLELEQQAETVLSQLTEEKSIHELEQQLEHIDRRIERLGPINLVAIDECKEKEALKTFYDAQNNDLEQALTALEDAIQKIDKETRAKFKETFDAVNSCFIELFPKIFGGGRASLELTENDLLNTGVEIIAQPPGKKNSSIQLLSGGEKTMVAIALVFSIFQQNPAPFCMLDEVDAPLDDANVVRFSELVRDMSQKVQFIVITHNKVTMEMMHQLMGVTMNEPGVSRIVSVDIKEAAKLVE